MLTQLRNEKFMKRVMLGTLIIVIPSFLFFYGFGSRGSRGDYSGTDIAKIRKDVWYKYFTKWQVVDRSEIATAKRDLANKYAYFAYKLGKQVDPNKLEELVPNKDAIIKAVDQRIMLNYANEKGIKVSKGEVVEEIKKSFKKDGEELTAEKFASILENAGISEKTFVDNVSENILLRKVAADVSEQSKVSLFELWQQYLITKEKLKIDDVAFTVSEYIGKVKADDKVLKEYYDVNTEDFRIPDQIEYEYISVLKDDIKNMLKADAGEVQAAYNVKKENEYKKVNAKKVKHIMLRVSSGDEEKIQKEKETLINEVYDKLKKGEDFAKLADEYSEDFNNTDFMNNNQKKGGSLGWLDENAEGYGDFFKDELAKLKKGDLGKPFKSPVGWHIIKVEDYEDVYYTPLEEVRATLEQDIVEKKVSSEYDKRSKEFYDAAGKYTTLDSIAKALNITKKNTGLIDKDSQTIAGIGDIANFKRDLEELQKGQTTDILESDNGLLLISLVNEVPTYIPPITNEKLKLTLEKKYRLFKANELAKKDADDFFAKIKKSDDFENAAKEMKYEIKTSEEFSRDSNLVGGIGYIENIAKDTYKLPIGAVKLSVVGQDVAKPDIYIVWKLKEKKEPSKDDFKKDLKSISEEVINIKQNIFLEEWLVDQREGIEYDINPSVLAEPKAEQE